MDELRAGRLASALREEISDILRNEIKDPRVGFVSLTEVEVSHDLRQAKIHCSVLGTDDDKRRAMEGLRSATGFIRGEVAKRIRLRFAPELIFALDESIARGVRVVDLISRVVPEPKPPAKES